jgi:uncharacterized membrane protein
MEGTGSSLVVSIAAELVLEERAYHDFVLISCIVMLFLCCQFFPLVTKTDHFDIFQADAIMSRLNISDYQKEGDRPTLLITSDIVCLDFLCYAILRGTWMLY